MGNIEAHPEGFNALRRMYTDVQEPMMEAASEAVSANTNPFANMFNDSSNNGDSNSNSNSNSSTQNTPLSNPWAPTPPAQGSAGTGVAANPFMGAFGGGMGGM